MAEMFPPTEKAQLEDDKYQEDWIKIHDELMFREKQLKNLIITNNTL